MILEYDSAEEMVSDILAHAQRNKDEALTGVIVKGQSIQKVSYDDKDGLKTDIIDSNDFYKPRAGRQ